MVAQRAAEYNDVIRDVASRVNGAQGDRIRVSEEVVKIDFTENHLSMDCFHPNPEGQRILSAASWQSTWWAPNWTAHEDDILQSRLQLSSRCDREKSLEGSSMGGPGKGPKYSMSGSCRTWFRQPASERAVGRIDYDR
jgi:hypothetical protein